MLRAVIYCRCSTEEESQKDALVKQVQEAEECIRQKEWTLVNSYVESKSGTTTKGRTEYNRLFEDMSEDKFDIIVIKSQDRLMRNVKEWYLFLDRLVTSGKKLYMYLEQKFYTPDDALITGIKAILAEEYSAELSKKINNAHKNRQKNGEVFIFPPQTPGLVRVAKGQYELVKEESEAIHMMFQLAKQYGCGAIASELKKNGMFDRHGTPFEEEAIRRIIRNPIHCGTVIQNKRHFDFQMKKMIKVPKEEWIIHKNVLPASVTEREWIEANRAMDERAEARNVKKYTPRGAHIGKYDLSKKIRCGECGCTYYRSYRKKYKSDQYIIEWKCSSYLYHGKTKEGCKNILLNEEKLFQLLKKVCISSYHGKRMDAAEIIEKTLVLLEKAMKKKEDQSGRKRLKQRIKSIEQEKDLLLDKLLKNVITDAVYMKKEKELEEREKRLKRELEAFRSEEERKIILKQRISTIRQKLENGLVERAELSEMIDNIEVIKVYQDHLEIRFCLSKMLGIKQDNLQMVTPDQRMMQTAAAVLCAIPDDLVYHRQKEAERERIVKYMKDEPHITAKQIAERENISLTTANYRIKKLKQQGRIRFDGKGGKGKWIVIEEEGK